MLANKNEGTLRATSACQQKKQLTIEPAAAPKFIPTCALTPELIRRVAHSNVNRILSPYIEISQTE